MLLKIHAISVVYLFVYFTIVFVLGGVVVKDVKERRILGFVNFVLCSFCKYM